jgi:very-short-patch-repair endonuclease
MHDPDRRRRRDTQIARLSHEQAGVAHRAQLYGLGLSRGEVRAELRARRWKRHGRQTIGLHTGPLEARALRYRAVFETARLAALDGVSALIDAGLTGYREPLIHVSMPKGTVFRRSRGVRPHETRRRYDGDFVVVNGLPRVHLADAAVRGALWADTDRQATLILIMVVQQCLVTAAELHEALSRIIRDKRRGLIKSVLADVTDGVQSMGELDFARMCRRHGLPSPSRQVWRRLPDGRACLDVYFEEFGVVIEIEGIHQAAVASVIGDSARQNWLTIANEKVLRIPVAGLRSHEDLFMGQVDALLERNGWVFGERALRP